MENKVIKEAVETFNESKEDMIESAKSFSKEPNSDSNSEYVQVLLGHWFSESDKRDLYLLKIVIDKQTFEIWKVFLIQKSPVNEQFDITDKCDLN